jgi:hypothetical protein
MQLPTRNADSKINGRLFLRLAMTTDLPDEKFNVDIIETSPPQICRWLLS